MCEKRTRKIKKGSQITRLREARRLQRLQRLASPTTTEETTPPRCPPSVVDKTVQNQVILELAWKTVALMHKNRLIQQKIIALQKETEEYVSTVMNSPENRRRYIQHVRMYGIPQSIHFQHAEEPNNNVPMKLEPNE